MILSFDLGTGGAKICLFRDDGSLFGKVFKAYQTRYAGPEYHLQAPADWWTAVKAGAAELLAENPAVKNSIHAIAVSGHSLAVVPIDSSGNLVFKEIPIWSDTRAKKQTGQFFETVDREQWYMTTGNGFSEECYSIFKIMWYRENFPDEYKRIFKILGSKDYLNFIMTGNIATDYSYASGSGVYDLSRRGYDSSLLDASGVQPGLLPEPAASDACIGSLKPESAAQLGLSADVKVYCGGVDNSCMALGARNLKDGRVYLSLGSSAWIAVSSEKPLVDLNIKPFVFEHVVPDMYTSATSIFSAGSSLQWFRDTVAVSLKNRAQAEGLDAYSLIGETAEKSLPGANGVIFNPTFAGSPAAGDYQNITGAFLNLRLNTGLEDLCRAVFEGIVFELSLMHKKLKNICSLENEIVIVGGGSRSPFWRQIFADVFGCSFKRISTDQDAAALGAAALAAVGSRTWDDYSYIENVIEDVEEILPSENSALYKGIESRYAATMRMLSEIGAVLNEKIEQS